MTGAARLATGSSHSLAIREDGSLWIWGRNEVLTPRRVMDEVTAVAGSRSNIVSPLIRGRLPKPSLRSLRA